MWPGVKEGIYSDGNAIRQVDERRAAINDHLDVPSMSSSPVTVAVCASELGAATNGSFLASPWLSIGSTVAMLNQSTVMM